MVFIPSKYSGTKVQEKLSNMKMFVLKRDGRKEPVMFDKITSRIQKLCYGLNMDYIDPPSITLKVISGLYSGVSTVELDNLAAETAIMLSNEHPHYAVLAARIEISNLHKETKKSFSEVVEDLYKAGEADGFIHPKMDKRFYRIVKENENALNSAIIYDKDFSYSYFAIKVLENDFLKKVDGKVIERPQHLLMRIAVAIHGDNIEEVIETYNNLSGKWYIHSPSAMRNAGFINGQLLSDCCFSMKSDSIEGIFDSLSDFSLLARSDLSVGMNVHCIRAKGSYIAGTNGNSNGLVPMLRVYNSKAKGTLRGRTGKTANLTIYLETWHADILDFLTLKKPTGKDEQRARDCNYALWISDLFMERVREDGDWCLMSPNDSEDLQKLYGDSFKEKFLKFEREGRCVKKLKARQIWEAIYESQMETGGPAMFYKDTCNRKSNQKNVGTLLNSSHDGALMSYVSADEVPVFGSSLLCLDSFVTPDKQFDFSHLKECTKSLCRSLDKMIDVSTYALRESEVAAKKHRPIAIGVMGLADAFILMKYPFESDEAKLLNKQIFETIYYGAMESSCELAEALGPYETYEGSPVCKGVFQYDMWNVTPTPLHDWASLKGKVVQSGVRNSVLVACGTSSVSATIQNCVEGTEALPSTLHNRKVLGGTLKVVNHHLLKTFTDLGIWDSALEAAIKEDDGSLQDIECIPEDVKQLYKTAWEIPQKIVLEMAVDRAAFIDQSQTLKVRVVDPNYGKFSSMHIFAWKAGLKTGMTQFLKKSSASSSISNKQVQTEAHKSVSNGNGSHETQEENENVADMMCSLDNKEDCLSCGS